VRDIENRATAEELLEHNWITKASKEEEEKVNPEE